MMTSSYNISHAGQNRVADADVLTPPASLQLWKTVLHWSESNGPSGQILDYPRSASLCKEALIVSATIIIKSARTNRRKRQ